MNVPELLTTPEGKTMEFRRDLSSLTPVLKTLVAFANTSGGTLIIGVAEKTAKRDLAALKARALIQFVGPPKTGSYRLVGRE